MDCDRNNDHKFERIHLDLGCSARGKRDTPWDEWMEIWDWDIIGLIPKHIKGKSELCLNASWWSEYRWKEWIQQMFEYFEGRKFFEELEIIMDQQIKLGRFRRLYGGLDLIDEIMKDWIDVEDKMWESIGVKWIIIESEISCFIGDKEFKLEKNTIDMMLKPKLNEYKAANNGFDFQLSYSQRPNCKEVALYVRFEKDFR